MEGSESIMANLKLIQSGGFIGKTLTSETDTKIDAKEIIKEIKKATGETNKDLRDAFEHKLIIDGKTEISFDPGKLEDGRIKKVIENKLIKNLKAH